MTKKELFEALAAFNVNLPKKTSKADLEDALENCLEIEAENAPTPELTAAEKRAAGIEKQRVTQTATMKISDRRVTELDSGDVYKNCCRAWKDDRFSSSQCDTLVGKLMKAAKLGNFPVEEMNGQKWRLTSAVEADAAATLEADAEVAAEA